MADATIADVTQELRDTNDVIIDVRKNTSELVPRFGSLQSTFVSKLDELIEFMRGNELQQLETRREQSKALAGPLSTSIDKEKKDEKGLLENFTGGLIADAKALLAPIMSIIRMVIKGGVIALVIGGLFTLFKTIKDNPVFLETVESIKNIWENSIIPTFNDIRKSVMDFIESPAFDRIVEVMDTLRTVFQTLFLRQLENVVDTISNVFEGLADVISGLLEFDLGKIYTGLNKVIGSIVSGIVSTIDNMITAVLEMFGVSFEGDATLFEAITRGVKNVFSSIKNGILSVFTGAKNWIANQLGFSDGQMPSISDIVLGILTAPYDLVRSVASWVAGKLGFDQVSDFLSSFSFSDIVSSIFNAPVNLLRSAKDWILGKLGFDGEEMPSIKDIVFGILTAPANLIRSAANWLLSKFGLDEETIPDPTDIIMSIIKAPFRILEEIREWIAEKVSGFVKTVAKFIPGPIKSLLGINKNDEENDDDSEGITDKATSAVSSAAGFVGGLFGGNDDSEGIIDKATGAVSSAAGFVGGLFGGNDDEEQIGVCSRPSRVDVGSQLEREGAQQRDAQREQAAARTATNGGGGNTNISTNVQNNQQSIIRNRPPAGSQPDNVSDTIMEAWAP